jgi:uncharacterized membrane protein YqjE
VQQSSTPEALSSVDLVKELTSNVSLLVQRQVRLATLEARRELTRGLTTVELLGSGGFIAIIGVLLLLVAAVIGLGVAFGGRYWLSALVVAAPLLFIGLLLGGLGLRKRGTERLPRSRAELQKELSWAKHRAT